MDDIPDRDLLHDRAIRRMRGLAWLVLGMGVLAGAALAAGTALGGGPLWLSVFLPLGLLLIFGLIAGAAFRRAHRETTLFQGADRATQRAVARALKAGGTDDPRVDALARDLAQRSLRRRGAVWAMTAAVVLVAAGLILNVIADGLRPIQLVMLLGLGCYLYALVTVWQTRLRSRRYPGVRQ
ncbi:hypothetical protein [Actinoplanes sp. N902-109]|uniref:hypothetical protein n=1 Tax=Actinoplanes sp. (strain N902-109) TaxID=649831 RepID=UPI0003295E36|nr:hypothetical protein [Actinoplanes sp. N902-109]AGL20953.1 hypothetical protein L083_7443 [Actinoplanes sp. N902-109]